LGFQQLYLSPDVPSFSVSFAGIQISSSYIWSFITSMLLLLVFFIFFKYSNLGLSMRAAADNQKLSVALGISPRKILSLTWAISAAVATAGGILLASLSSLHVNLSYIGLTVFPVVILGGLDSIAGATIGGLVVGVIEAIAGSISLRSSAGFSAGSPVCFLLIILLVKPMDFSNKRNRKALNHDRVFCKQKMDFAVDLLLSISFLPLHSLLLYQIHSLPCQYDRHRSDRCFGVKHSDRLYRIDLHGAGRVHGGRRLYCGHPQHPAQAFLVQLAAAVSSPR
jgi:hypothetical protein